MTGEASPAGVSSAAPRGLFVGLTTMDVLHRAAGRPGPDEKVTATRQDVAAGGPAANAAVTFAALGGGARLLSALGTAGPALVAREDLRRHGVEILDAAEPGHRLAVSAVLVEEDSGARSVVSADAALAAAAQVRAPAGLALDAVDVVLLDGHHPALARAALAALDEAGRRPAVVLDCGRWRPVFAELLPAADVAALSADFRLPGVDGGEATARAVLATGARAVVLTDGGGPVRWWTEAASGTVAVERVAARDTLGAGDAFHGALAAAIGSGTPLPQAAALAAQVATLRVRSIGPRDWLTHLRPWWSAGAGPAGPAG